MKTILVTGASSGIGRAIAVECSKIGAKIVVSGRNITKLQETLSLLEGQNNSLIVADLNNIENIESLCEQVPMLDGIVHNAGVSKRSLCKDIEDEDFNNIIYTNLRAPVMLQKTLLLNKKINKESSIIFIASRASTAPSIGNAIYSSSKGAIISYSKVLALELAPRKIRVNCICPGMVWTDLITDGVISKEAFKEAELKYPLKRFGQPEDVAYLTIYLLSDASAWMTGSCIDITGGGEGILV